MKQKWISAVNNAMTFYNRDVSESRLLQPISLPKYIANLEEGWQMGSAGEVRITIQNEEKNLVIEVADNGMGRKASSGQDTGGTDKGMEMMSHFFDLYHGITGVKVLSEVVDQKDKAGNPAGTTVVVRIFSVS